MDTLKVSFVLKKGKLNKSGKAPINARITVNGQRFELATKQFIEPLKWDEHSHQVKGRNAESNQVNHYLHDFKSKIIKEFNLLAEAKETVSISQLKNVLTGEKVKVKTLLEVFEENNKIMNTEKGTKYIANTVKRYEISINRLSEFLKQDITGTEVTLDKLNHQFMQRYENFLRTKYGCGHNTAMKYLKHLKKVIHQAMAYGYTNVDPFASYTTAYKEVNRGFLTQSEVNSIVDKKLHGSRLNEVRDIFIFACFTGISYADLETLSSDNIQTHIKTGKVIVLERKKTRVRAVIPILDNAQKILDKYANHPICQSRNILLPMRSNQKLNLTLKDIGDLCDIKTNLSMHLSRHTFATTIALSNNVPLDVVQKILGHKNIQTTQIYSRTLDDKVVNDMKNLDIKLKQDNSSLKVAL